MSQPGKIILTPETFLHLQVIELKVILLSQDLEKLKTQLLALHEAKQAVMLAHDLDPSKSYDANEATYTLTEKD